MSTRRRTQAMNLESFFIFVTPLVALICAMGEARDMKAGVGALIMSAFVGLILGIGGAMCTIALATKVQFQRVRRESKLISVSVVLAHFFVPLIVTTVACVVTVWFLSVVL